MGTFHVAYVTGAPAAGKTTLVTSLPSSVQPLKVYSYSALLTERIKAREQRQLVQDDIRRHSAGLITPEDVAALDNELVATVRTEREHSHVIIDSHPVTKETYGFRVTPFSVKQVEALRPTLVFVLYAPSEVIIHRIKADSGGRPIPTMFDATFHTDLQASVALIYGVNLGIPVYFLDSDKPREELVAEVARRMSLVQQ